MKRKGCLSSFIAIVLCLSSFTVFGEKNINRIDIYSPANAYSVSAEKIAETITDDEGNVLIEAVAYYPVIENPTEIPCINTINFDYKLDADKFIEEAKAKKVMQL